MKLFEPQFLLFYGLILFPLVAGGAIVWVVTSSKRNAAEPPAAYPATVGQEVRNLTSPDGTPQATVDAPVLRTWKTSAGFSVLGLLVGFPLLMILALLLAIVPMMLTGMGSPQSGSRVVGLAGNTLMLLYAVVVYPSYFSKKPALRSSRAISFANLMFGGLIFGLLWNSNLSKRTKGSSYIVSAVLSGLMCLQLALGILVALLLGA